MCVLGGTEMDMMFSVSIEGVADAPADHLEAMLDAAMEKLLAAGAADPAIGATGAAGTIEVTITVEASSVDRALTAALGIVRDALGPDTADWRAARATRVEPSSA